MWRIEKDFSFSAAHFLHDLPDDHPCSRMHGHNYVVKLILEADGLNTPGFVRDYRELDEFKKWLDINFDHQLINDLEQHIGGNPSAENMARAIYEVAAKLYPEVVAVGVSETPKTWAYYMPDVVAVRDRIVLALEDLAGELPTSSERRRVAGALLDILKDTQLRKP